MRKSYNTIPDVRNESVDGARRFFRAISDIVTHLDECRGRTKTCQDLFAPSMEAQRLKLRESCEKLMFLDPLGHGQKAEELLWRKGYYDVVSTAKRLRKNNAWSPVEVAYIRNHLYAGVGHYYHLVFRLQIEFKLDLQDVIDFPLLGNDFGLLKGKTSSRKKIDPACVEWALGAIHRCLICLGDMSRYFMDLNPRWDSGLALRYYLQALNMNPKIGMPHNQLGTLSGNKNYCVDAAYHYMRCLTSMEPFEGAAGNLQRIFSKAAKWLEVINSTNLLEDNALVVAPTERIRCFISRFLILVDTWFFNKTSASVQLCHETLQDLQFCLGFAKPFPADVNSIEEQEDLDELSFLQSNDENCEKPESLRDEVVSKMVVMLLLCVSKLQAKSSQQLSEVIAFTLAVFSQVIQQVILHIHGSVFNISLNTPTTIVSSPVLNDLNSTTSIVSSPDTVCETKSGIEKPANEKDKCLNGYIDPAFQNGDDTKAKKREKKTTNLLKKLRRRRRRRKSSAISSEDSDYSDGDSPYGTSSSSDDGNSDLSDIEEPCLICSDEDDDEDVIVDDDDSDDSETSNSLQIEPKKLGSQEVVTLCNGKSRSPSEVAETGAFVPNGESKPVLNGDLDASLSLQVTLPSEKPLDPADVIQLVAEEGLLDVIKICVDWLHGNSNIVKACGQTSRTLLARFITLLNLINVDASALMEQNDGAKIYKLKNIQEIYKKIPLPEDIDLKGLSLLKSAHDLIDWDFLKYNSLHSKEEALVRVYKLVDFGHFLATMEETGVTYDKISRLFSIAPNTNENGVPPPEVKVEEKPTEPDEKLVIIGGVPVRADPLQKHMGQLWLRAEVKDLEARSLRTPKFSPYLAVDAEALIYHLRLVKQLTGSRKFIVLIPDAVMNYLDRKKNELSRVREAIRWLESQYRYGNRFLRAQRPHEQLPLPLIKYPKRKEEAAWLFFNIMECCYYFTQSNPTLRDLDIDFAVVTLLTGERPAKDDTSKTFSPLGIANSAGINLEHIEAFHAKWKTSSKSHG